MITTQFAELVFGFVYAVGTDADPVVTVLENYLTQYLYKTETFRISEHLRSLDLKIKDRIIKCDVSRFCTIAIRV